VEEKKGDGQVGDKAGGKAADSDTEGLLRVVVGKRQALIAISRIVVIQKVPFGWWRR
jgi:hypothetical protein